MDVRLVQIYSYNGNLANIEVYGNSRVITIFIQRSIFNGMKARPLIINNAHLTH